jgi:hypothetical protein
MTDETPAAKDARLRKTSAAYRISRHIMEPIQVYCHCAIPDGRSNQISGGRATVVCRTCDYMVRRS